MQPMAAPRRGLKDSTRRSAAKLPPVFALFCGGIGWGHPQRSRLNHNDTKRTTFCPSGHSGHRVSHAVAWASGPHCFSFAGRGVPVIFIIFESIYLRGSSKKVKSVKIWGCMLNLFMQHGWFFHPVAFFTSPLHSPAFNPQGSPFHRKRYGVRWGGILEYR